MPLPEILTAIDEEANRQVSSIEQDARRRGQAILDEARAKAKAERARLSTSREAAGRQTVARLVNHARLEADRALRLAQEELYQTALQRAGARLAKVRDTASYPAVFTDLLVEATDFLPDAITLAVDPRDEHLARTVTQDLGLSFEISPSLTTWGGVQLTTGDGRLVENTLESRLYKADPALRRLAVSMCPELVRDGR
jgi:vacuolar-type H+-ATPase subunit E/Vma4